MLRDCIRVSKNNLTRLLVMIYCPGVLSRATLMLALMRSRSSAVVARGEGCRFRYITVSLGDLEDESLRSVLTLLSQVTH